MRRVIFTFIYFTPVLLIFFLGSQMAYSQVEGKFEVYQAIPELTGFSELAGIPSGEVVMLRGRISAVSCELTPCGSDLIIYRERPAEDREVRYQEKFEEVFPAFVLELPDGRVTIYPSETRERVIQHEIHSVPSGDKALTGFQIGDVVTVQGQWQPQQTALIDVTGITSSDKQGLIAEWQEAFAQVIWARNILGLLTGLGVMLLIVQLRRNRNKPSEEIEEWQPQTTTEVPTA